MTKQDYSRDIQKYQTVSTKASISDTNPAFRRQVEAAQSATVVSAVGPEANTYTGDTTNVEFVNAVVKPFIPEWLYRPLYGRPRSLNIPEIRRLAKSPMAATCIKTIVDQVASVPWQIRMRDPEMAPNEAAIKEVTGRLENPNRNKEDLTVILKKLMRDILEVDAGVLAKVYSRDSYMQGNIYEALLPLGRRKMLEFYAYDGGCLSYYNLVETEEGHMPIGQIVNHKLTPKVKTYNFETGNIEWKRIVGHKKSGLSKIWRRIKAKTNTRHRTIEAISHMIPTPDGEVNSDDLQVGDVIYTQQNTLNEVQRQILIGSLLGDGGLRKGDSEQAKYYFKETHGDKQKDYLMWKYENFRELEPVYRTYYSSYGEGYPETLKHEFKTRADIVFEEFVTLKYPEYDKSIFDELGVLGLAVWLQDDGSGTKHGGVNISSHNIPVDVQKYALSKIKEKWGINGCLSLDSKCGMWYIRFNQKDGRKLVELVKPYLHESMAYKFGCHGKPPIKPETRLDICETVIFEIEEVNKAATKFDIEVEDNHNFYCNGILVHNTFTINPDPHGLLPDQNAYFQYNFHQQSMPVPFGRDEIVYMMSNPQTNQIYGISPMEMCYDVIRYVVFGVTSGIDYFTRNEIPPGIISLLEADTDHINEFQARLADKVVIQDSQTEEQRWVSSKVPITNQDVKFTPLSLTPEVMKLLESQQWYSKLILACFDEETEILTENGFKLFKDLDEKEKVAQVDKETLEITFTKPEAYQTYDFDGDMYYYKTKTCDLAVTPDHRMLFANDTKFYGGDYNWEVKQACEFNRGIIPQAGNWVGEQIEELEFMTKNTGSRNHQETYTFNIKGDLFCKFMGIWLSDGWVQGTGDVVLCASEVYPENIQVIEKLLADMNVKYTKAETSVRANLHTTELSENKLIKYRFANMAFNDYLSQFGKAKDKFVPKIILNSTPAQIELFLEYFMYGDGSEGKHIKGRNDRYGSMSKALMNGLQEMLIKTGKSATLYQNSSNGCWELTVRKTKTDKIENKFYSRIIRDSLEIKKYTGKVYDVTVPSHFIVVRRNGRVSISGNCFGVTPSEIGWTDDSNKATELSQNEVFKRKTVMPSLDCLEYYVNMEIIPEYGYEDLYFEFIRKDIQSDLREQKLWDAQLKNGQRTVNEWREEHGDLAPVSWGDEPYKAFGGGGFGDSNMFADKIGEGQGD